MDDTVEAAIKFIEKVGPTVEERIQSDRSKKKISQEEYDSILSKFKKIWEDSEEAQENTRKVAKRIQKLIQNMLENQSLNWKKLKQKNTDVQTKNEVEAEMIKKQQEVDQNRPQGRYNNDDGNYRGNDRRGGGDRRNNDRGGDNRRDDRRDGEKVYMKKQNSVLSNEGGGSGRGRRRNDKKGGNDAAGYQARGQNNTPKGQGEGQANKPEAFELTEDQLKTRLQVLFNKFVKNEAPSEEEKKEENNFQYVKDLIMSGSVKTENETKKLRADDIFTHLLGKMVDMDGKVIKENFQAFMEAWFESRCFEQSSWKFVVKKIIVDLENYISDLPEIPVWLCQGLIIPLLRKNFIQLTDLQWYNEEDKDELFDVSGQYKVAALLIADAKKQGGKTDDQIK